MTQTTTPAQPLTIGTGLRAELADGTVVTATYVNGAGYKVMARRNGNLIASQLHTFETDAIRAVAALIAEHAPVQAESPAVRLAPVAKGAATKVTDPQWTALAVAAFCGTVQRGGHEGQASVKTLTAMAKRGYLELIYEARADARKVPIAGRITGAGRIRLAELTAADRETAEYAARLAANLGFDQPATSHAPIAA